MDGQLSFPGADEPEEPSDHPREASAEELAQIRAEQRLPVETVALGYIGIEQARMQLAAGKPARTTIKRKCTVCDSDLADVNPNDQHLTAHCAGCGRYIAHLPRSDFGLSTRPVANRGRMSPKRRVRILARDRGRCVLCGQAGEGVELTVDHLLTIDDGLRLGADLELLDHDLNLAAMCYPCQLGKGNISSPLVFYIGLLLLRAESARSKGMPLEPVTVTPPAVLPEA